MQKFSTDNLNNIFSIKNSVKRVFVLFPLLYSFIIFYHGHVKGIFQFPFEVNYAITFFLFFFAIFYRDYIFHINKWFYCALLFLTLPLIIGIYYEWSTRDISADFVRYIAPFVGFLAGLALLKRVSLKDLFILLYFFGFLELCFFYSSVYTKTMDVIVTGNFIDYAENGLEVKILFTLLFYFSIKNKLFNHFTNVLLSGYILGFLINPIMLQSKSGLIVCLFILTIIFIFYSNKLEKLIMAILALLISAFIIYGIDFKEVFERFRNAYDSIIYLQYGLDPSTSYRVAEIINIFKSLMEEPLARLPFGFGLGAILYDTYAPFMGGVHAENFRADGGVHHIFTVYFAYIFRYGLVGLILLMYWIYSCYIEISKNKSRDFVTNVVISSFKIFIVSSLLADTFVPVHVYGNASFGFFLAFGIIIASKSINKEYLIKSENK